MKTAYSFCLLVAGMVASDAGGAPSLKDVGDIGKVVDSQGVTSVRAKAGNRWTGAGAHLPIKPGDWIRTDVRGANALHVKLAGGSELILGPGTLIEMGDAENLKLVRGELEVTAGEGRKVKVGSGEGKVFEVEKAAVLRRKDGGDVEVLEKEPNWLKGFKGTVVSESMGQLLASVEGRNTPLTLGYHKVSVDIRDQIALTTIEESFVNHTDSQLEGIFYFPLPQDASISGFGMWINGELVEADVVEKQRAREIYETILRERRDPGLLEWTGGNIFKARVFPIFGRSEKRIKITYTQVLPYVNGSYRYSYALQSEMLKANPLRELAVNVRVYSAVPIKQFTCTSHDARVSMTEHAAQAEFTAQEYTPEADFEVEIEIDRTASPVTIVPHRRGEDGYFLALVTPPDEGVGWEREMVADGDPVNLIILADTSGSMDRGARENQDALIGALLGSLGDKDSFSLATCDSEVRWFSAADFAGTREEYVEMARGWVAARSSLGWSDLEKAFASVMESLDGGDDNTHVIYIGDGVITTGDADPVAFANRLRQLHGGKGGTFHAVAPTSSYEPGVLKSIASLGGGSVRRISGSDTPSEVATKLLAEISAPGIRDMSVSFQGVRTARVYPETLPNLPPGKQQMVLGRYLPEGEGQRGEILIKGIRDGKVVEFKAPVVMKDAEGGNSFIPRLWARMHLDALLEQGRTPEVKEDVIALSEEFHIMTPYTSFLVLESDADRERFKVKRHFRMRDGEKFFAEGRDAAERDLLQKQMRIAGTWRLNLQRRYLGELGTLGRHSLLGYPVRSSGRTEESEIGGWGGYSGVKAPLGQNLYWESDEVIGKELKNEADYPVTPGDLSNSDTGGELHAEATPAPVVDDVPADLREIEGGDKPSEESPRGDGERERQASSGARAPSATMPAAVDSDYRSHAREFLGGADDLRRFSYRDVGATGGPSLAGIEEKLRKEAGAGIHRHGKLDYASDGYHWIHVMGDIESLFPALGGQIYVRPDRAGHPWPKEAIELADGLVRVERLAAVAGKGGVDVRVTTSHHDVRFKRVASVTTNRALVGNGRWVARSDSDRSDTVVHWWDGEERGVIGKAFGLGRVRKSAEGDQFAFPLGLNDGSDTSLASNWSGYGVRLEKDAAEDRVRLILSPPGGDKGSAQVYVIDTARRVMLSHDTLVNGKVVQRVEYSDFVQAGGEWWAKSVRTQDVEGKLTREDVIEVSELNGEAFAETYGEMLAGREKAIALKEPLPGVDEAKRAESEKRRSFESELVMLQHFALSQQWDRATEHFEQLKERSGERPGFSWLEMRFLGMKRRNEEVKQAVLAAARELAAKPSEGEYAAAAHLLSEGQRVMAVNEQHELLEVLKAVYGRMPEHTWGQKEWESLWMWSLQNIGWPDKAIVAAKLVAEKYGWDVHVQIQYGGMLANHGDRPAGIAYFENLLKQPHWNDAERNSLRQQMIAQLESSQKVGEIKAILGAVLKGEPEHIYEWTYQAYLSAMIRTDEVDEAYDLMDRWLAAATKTKDDAVMGDAVKARFEACLAVLFGNSYGVERNTVEERFHISLSEAVRRFALSEPYGFYAERIMGDYRFHQTDAVRALRKYYTGVLGKRAGELPFAQVQRLVGWAMVHDPAVEKDEWQSIVTALIGRWSEEKAVATRDQWASLIGGIVPSRISRESQTEFLRRQLEEGPESERPRYAAVLMEHVITGDWSEASESEAFDLLYLVGSGHGDAAKDEGGVEVYYRAWWLLRLNDWVTTSGYAVLYGAVEKKEELSRTELAKVSREKWVEIRERLSKRLGEELEKREGIDVGFANWVNIERLYFDARLGRDPGVIAGECWEFLGDIDLTDAKEDRTWGEVVLIARYLGMLEYLAAKPKADEGLVERVLAVHDAGIKAAPDRDGWKYRKYRLLVALDRADQLKESLRVWIRPGEVDSQWRIALGYLLAELNEIEAAIVEFEAVEKADELKPREYRVLADWYLVKDEKEKREAALAGYYGTMADYQLSSLIYQRTAQIRQGFENGVPEDLDPETVTMMTVLLRKTRQPASYAHQVGELYRYTKDFRLLECVPEGIIGHTAMEVYPYLQNLTSVHEQIRDEATADTIFGQMEVVRKRAVTTADARGLDLLELLVRRKASEVLNQPGQHLPLALAAMQRAFGREWEDGERKQMAGFLYGLGRITQKVLADEQLREMEVLHREEKADADRMEIGFLRGQLLWQYERHDDAIEVLAFVLAGVEDAGGGVLPYAAQNVLHFYLHYLVERGQYAGAEKEILRLLDQDVVKALRYWLVNRKYQLYTQALASGGTVSLGKGEVLYQEVERLMHAELPKVDHELRAGIAGGLTGLYSAAHQVGIGSARADVRRFAYGAFDELVPFETANYQGLVSGLGSTLRDMLGPVEGLAFLIDRHEKEPASFRAAGQGGWQVFGGSIADFRFHAKEGIGALEPRLLAIVLDELRRHLREQGSGYNGIFWGLNNTYFWTEKKGDFAKVAEEVLEEKRTSLKTVIHVAQYFHDGLQLSSRAIEVLEEAYKRKLLDETGWVLLITYLESAGRWREAEEYLNPLIAFRPDNLDYRTRLMKAYFHLGERAKLVSVLDGIAERWHAKGWWNEGTLATVASACYATELWERAVPYFDELIPMYRRARADQGTGDGVLSGYYVMLASCHQHLGDTPKAVEAAAGAIVSWGSDHGNREQAFGTLRAVLQGAQDLGAYVALLDKEVEETGLENPTVRKALGQVYLERGDAELAIRQLRLALEAEPNDAQGHEALVQAYDKKGDAEGAIAQILESVELGRRNIQLFKELGDRYEKAGRKLEAERARTGIVEALPNESEGHTMLAEIRENQGRFEDAVSHWEQVAEIRALEPTGLLRLAEAQVRAGKKGEAVEAWKKVLAKEWPSRFGDVGEVARRRMGEVGN